MHLPPLIPPASITPYLSCSEVINCTNAQIRSIARTITASDADDVERARTLYLWVRDSVSHSVDADRPELVINAVDVLLSGHGMCFGKSHLLVALCRALGIPAGLCYQRVRKEDASFVLHGLTAVYLEPLDRWVRLDPRGNKPGIEAAFSISPELIAYEPRYDGEWLDQHVYPEPWHEVCQIAALATGTADFIERTADLQAPPVHHSRVVVTSSSCIT